MFSYRLIFTLNPMFFQTSHYPQFSSTFSSHRRLASLAACFWSLVFLLFSFGCKRQVDNAGDAAADAIAEQLRPVNKTYDLGPLQVRLHLERSCLDITETTTLRLEAEAPEEYAFEWPPFEQGTGQFLKPEVRFENPRLTSKGTMLHAREYVLEPLIAQEYAIQPMTFTFINKRGDHDTTDKKHQIETEPIDIEVTMPPPEVWEKIDIVEEPELIPNQQLEPDAKNGRQWLLTIAAALGAASAIFAIWRRKIRQAEKCPEIPPHLLALRALEELVAMQLIAKGERKKFYNQISHILRQYIENRFQLRAPEQTTEEFLQHLKTAPHGLVREHQELLADFLQHCDLVKFAAHQPEDQEVQKTFDACKKFILETAVEIADNN